MQGQPLIIKDWQNGVGDSPNVGFGLMKNIDIESYPGATRTQKTLTSMTNYIVGQTVTFTGGFPNFCATAASLIPQATLDDGRSTYAGAAVVFSTTGSLPSPLVAGTVYYMVYEGTQLFLVNTTYGGAIGGSGITVTGVGTGVHTVTPVVMTTPTFEIQDPNTGFFFLQDDSGRVWNTHADNTFNLMNGNSLSSATGNGICLFRVSDSSHTYLLVFRNGSIDIADVTTTANVDTPSWTNGWQTSLNTGLRHFAIVGQDNIIYFTDGRWIGSIQEIPGQVFLPSNSSTYNYNTKALSLPQTEVAWCLEELGVNLLVGGLSYNKIYPWDRSSTSFNLPLICPEYGIYAMKNSGNLIYVFAGTKGNIYRTTGGFVNLFKSVPGYLTDNLGVLQANQIAWGGVAVRNSGLLFGMASVSNPSFNGVYLLYPDGRLVQDNTPYIGATLPTTIIATSDFYRIGYSGGADHSNNVRHPQGSYSTVIHSQLYRIGNKKSFAKYSRVEVQLGRVATAGNVRLSYRRDVSSSFTVMATFSSDSVSTSFTQDVGITNIENLQVQVEHDGDIELMEVRLIP